MDRTPRGHTDASPRARAMGATVVRSVHGPSAPAAYS